MARADYRRAVAVAEQISVEQLREYSLQNIAARLAATDLPAALAVARRQPRRSLQIRALCAVADTVAARDRKRADEILDAAYESTLRLEDKSVLPDLFTTLAASWAAVNPRRALGVLPKNDDQAHWIAQLEWVALFSHIAVAFAPKDTKRALALARQVPEYQWSGEFTRHLGRAQTLSEIADRIRERDPRQARALLDEALALARKADPPEYRTQLWSTVLSSLARLDPARTRELLPQAVRDAGRVLPENSAPFALAMVTPVLQALPIDAALAVVADLKGQIGGSDDALQLIAEAAAKSAPERALAVARQIGDIGKRAQTLGDVADALMKEED
jgi:hypothetical protein